MQPRRRFGVLDALVLVAATATAFAITRADWPDYLRTFSPGGDAYRENFVNFAYRLRHLVYSVSYIAGAWSLALLALRLRKPRPRLRRLTRQPGMVASATAVVVLSLRAVNLGLMMGVSAAVLGGPVLGWFGETDELPLIPSEVGCAVAAAWIVQALGGRWRAESSWLDRTGRGLGLFWIGTIPLSLFSWNT